MKLKYFLGTLVLLFGHKASALYGAKPLSKGEGKFMVALHLLDRENNLPGSFCSGVIISPTRVITAGHCIEGIGTIIYDEPLQLLNIPRMVLVTNGTDRVQARIIRLAPSYFEYAGIQGEDLALIDLPRPLKDSEVISIAPGSVVKVGTPMTLMARGKKASTTVKRIRRHRSTFILTTDGSKAGVCQGDSGGALLVNLKGKYHLGGVIGRQSEGCVREDSLSYFPRLNF